MSNILIVNDSPMITAVLKAIVETDDEYSVQSTADNGLDAIHLARSLAPDLILMDLHMPRCNGKEAVRKIVDNNPGSRILITTATVISNGSLIFETLQHGALDYVKTPSLPYKTGHKVTRTQLQSGGKDLLLKMKGCLSSSPKLQQMRSKMEHRETFPTAQQNRHAAPLSQVPLSQALASNATPSSKIPFLAIGSSTGGPSTLVILLKHLPQRFPGPIFICQHIDDAFVHGLVDWLCATTGYSVEIAKNRATPLPGHVYIAPGGRFNLTISKAGRMIVSAAQEKDVYTPNINCLFRSLAENIGNNAIGVVLSGMGSDGALGLKAIEDAGGRVFVQNPNTAILPSMPESALRELQNTNVSYPVEHIGSIIERGKTK